MQRAVALDVTLGPLGPDVDCGAPGAAITTELCGSWDHDGPCPLAAHHTSAERAGDEVRLRIIYATEPHQVAQIAERIHAALITKWPVRRVAASALRPSEVDHAARLSRR